ncbi:MAG: nucleotidyltransferase family protein [Gemmobacter sp.]|nr:nucleotidyltransferase family protein [Gemmobacter sp.]
MTVKLAILIPAAGASTRMRGTDKLMADVDGLPLLRRQVLAALSTEAAVVVCVPPDRPAREQALADLPVVLVVVPDADQGMAASIRAGVAVLPLEVSGVMVALADMPDIGPADLAGMICDFATDPTRVLRATTADGVPGHPVIFPRRLFARLAQVTGDTGAREVLAAEAPRLHALPGQRALTDLDTPEAWADWRALRGLGA